MISLRDYQKEILEKIKSSQAKKVLVQLPTGAGKSVIMKTLAHQNPNHLILTHRIELKEMFRGYNAQMVETHYRRAKNKKYDLVLADEVHYSGFDKVLKRHDKVIGFTATPLRTGNQTSLSKNWDELIIGVNTQYLIDNDYLVPTENYSFFGFNKQGVPKSQGDFDLNSQFQMFQKNKVYKGVYENYLKLSYGKKALLFAPNIQATKQICEYLQRFLPKVKYIDSSLSSQERSEIVNWFKNTKGAILCNCNILTTGFDCPDVESIILYRATTSLSLYNQMIGRGVRKSENKKKCLVLDFGENIKRHGFWEDDQDWSLEKPAKKKGDPPVKLCPQCQKILRISATECDKCGYKYPVKKVKDQFVDLIKIEKPFEKKKRIDRQIYQSKNFNEALKIISDNNYSQKYLYANKKRFKHLFSKKTV